MFEERGEEREVEGEGMGGSRNERVWRRGREDGEDKIEERGERRKYV